MLPLYGSSLLTAVCMPPHRSICQVDCFEARKCTDAGSIGLVLTARKQTEIIEYQREVCACMLTIFEQQSNAVAARFDDETKTCS